MHRDAHVVGGELVLRRRLHRDADLAVAEHRVEQRAQHRGRGDDDHLLDVEDERADVPGLVLVRHRQRVRLGADAGHHRHQAARDVADADRQHDDRERRLAEDRPDDDALEADAEQRHRQHRRGKASQNGQPSSVISAEADERAEHHQLAVREADRLGRLVDQHEAERDQAVDAALRDAADDDLQCLHGSPRVGRGTAERPERVLVEFVSANPTGPLTAAQGRHAGYGDSLARLLDFAGHRVGRSTT